MRELNVKEITAAVRELCIKSNIELPQDVRKSLKSACEAETWPVASDILKIIDDNIQIAERDNIPLCQDTGMAIVFITVGQEVRLVGGNIRDAVNEGVRQGYRDGFLRKSIVADPLNRVNTGDNTPAVIYFDFDDSDKVTIEFTPKGFGSENMSRIKMLSPADGIDGVRDFVIETVKLAGPNPCPPTVVGVGIGGSFEYCAMLAKKALIRSFDKPNENPFYAKLEDELLEEINKLGTGPQGFGGKTTSLKVNIETFSTHIAGLPVAVNIGCHVTRHMKAVL